MNKIQASAAKLRRSSSGDRQRKALPANRRPASACGRTPRS